MLKQRQEETMIRAESNAKKSKEMYQDRIRKYEESIKDLVSVVRTKDRQIQRMEEKARESGVGEGEGKGRDESITQL